MKKIKTIAKAFSEKLPEGQDWYEKRLAICNACEYNTKNMSKENLSIADKIQISTGVCDNNNHCSACKCCIERKCSVKTEVCGLEYIDLEPKWLELESFSELDDTISIENLTPDFGEIYTDKTGFTYDMGNISSPKVEVNFRIRKTDDLNITNHRAGCSCTVSHMEVVDKNTSDFKLEISTISFRVGEVNTRDLSINYLGKKGKTKTIKVTLKCLKNV